MSLNPKVTPEHFYIGMSKFRLSEISNFSNQKEHAKKSQHILCFSHGRKDCTIKVRNTQGHAFDIAEYLNQVKRTMLEIDTKPQKQGVSRMQMRSANF